MKANTGRHRGDQEIDVSSVKLTVGIHAHIYQMLFKELHDSWTSVLPIMTVYYVFISP